ncbi:MFS transporter [Streptomyces werraensis]|uniref:MFS transporter n=1 Tax=Streptomyces werraensis TaxID=68284 RepID=UPI0033AE4812
MFGFFFLGLQYLQQILGYSPIQSGLALVAMAAGAMVFSPVAPGFARRYGMWAVMGVGMTLIAAGLGVLASTTDSGGVWPFLASTTLLGAGIAFAATPATEAIVAVLPPAQQGVASALNDLTRELGGVRASPSSAASSTPRTAPTPATRRAVCRTRPPTPRGTFWSAPCASRRRLAAVPEHNWPTRPERRSTLEWLTHCSAVSLSSSSVPLPPWPCCLTAPECGRVRRVRNDPRATLCWPWSSGVSFHR